MTPRQPTRFELERNGRSLVLEVPKPRAPAPNVLRKPQPAPVVHDLPPAAPPQPQMMSGAPRAPQSYPLDMWLLGKATQLMVLFARWYPKPRSCILAHRKWFVSGATRKIRTEACRDCDSRRNKAGVKPLNGEPEFCGYNGGCGCGHYVLARLNWKRGLKAWHCPAGRF